MSNSIQEKFADSIKSTLASQQEQWASIANKMLEDSMSLLELNMKATKHSLDNVAHASRKLIAAKSPQEFFAVDSGEIQEELKRMQSYVKDVSSIASNFQAEFSEAAKSQFSNTYGLAAKLGEEKSNAAPATGASPSDFMNSALESMKAGYAQWVAAATNGLQPASDAYILAPAETKHTPKKTAKTNHEAEAH